MLTHWHGQSQILGLSPHKNWDPPPVHKSGLNLMLPGKPGDMMDPKFFSHENKFSIWVPCLQRAKRVAEDYQVYSTEL